ncbi:hypothetical protein EVAR_21613_1 [Eumeta japonica]|uniref:Uncharacterized protein n=1 Tax=Eumeta variegata TaxID=151549 RepID=A0A4C1UXJ6_EUMVA|nr:hypothetical protein EVAR_21613_1 [Eumeta japonica]
MNSRATGKQAITVAHGCSQLQTRVASLLSMNRISEEREIDGGAMEVATRTLTGGYTIAKAVTSCLYSTIGAAHATFPVDGSRAGVRDVEM